MPHETNNETTIRPDGVYIPVEHIHETVMPKYEYQKPQNGFGIVYADPHPPVAPDASEDKEAE